MTAIVIDAKPSLAELAHFGVKGMKWGVRKERETAPNPSKSTESRKQRKESSKALNDYMWKAIADEPMFKTMTKEEYQALSTQGEEFAKGFAMRRVTQNPSTILKGQTYVSTLMEDSQFYRAAIPAVGPVAGGGLRGGGRKAYTKTHYELEIETVKKLNSPSEKARVDAYIDILETPVVKMKGKNAPITGRAYLEKVGYKPLFKRYETEELGLKSWQYLVDSLGDQKSPLAQAYFESLKSKGYNAVLDEFDAGKYTKKPIILLDPESTVRVRSVHRLSTDEINQAQRQLKGRSSP